ncbi:MAG: carbohydrate porin [Thermoanaerobaculia bacterium]
MIRRLTAVLGPFLLSSAPLAAGEPPRFDWGFAATVLTQTAPSFTNPYEGTNSFRNEGSAKPAATFLATLFGAVRLWEGAWLSLQPEFSDGSGVGGGTGIAAYPNQDVLRIPAIGGKPYIARVFLQQTFPLGPAGEPPEAPRRPEEKFLPAGNHLFAFPGRRLEITFGKICLADVFDGNDFVRDAHHGFWSWGLVNNGAWDFAADTRGYTWGLTVAYEGGPVAARAGAYMMPEVANGPTYDHDLAHAHGVNAEIEWDFAPDRQGAVRLLGYVNMADMGSYEESLTLAAASGTPPDITTTRETGRRKWGLALNAQLRLGHDLGAFSRLGWNDGATETFAYTEIDRTFQVGMALAGEAWKRPDDTLFAAVAVSGLSGAHRRYLEAGGLGFQLGDGQLTYGLETVLEVDYAANLTKAISAGLDAQLVVNPGYNRDRGPIAVFGARLHAHF